MIMCLHKLDFNQISKYCMGDYAYFLYKLLRIGFYLFFLLAAEKSCFFFQAQRTRLRRVYEDCIYEYRVIFRKVIEYLLVSEWLMNYSHHES